MVQTDINIDQLVDYSAEYSSYIKKHKITGDQLVGVCPFHNDKKESFSANLKDGRWYCFAEGRGGNFTTFYAELNGISTDEAYKQILDKYGALKEPEPPKQKEKAPGTESYTLEEYAFNKRLPIEFLKETCRASTGKDRDKKSFLKLPYFNEEKTDPS